MDLIQSDPAGSRELTGEENLWTEVIALAVGDLQRPRYRAEARRWLWSDGEEPGSFVWVCHLVGLDPGGGSKNVGIACQPPMAGFYLKQASRIDRMGNLFFMRRFPVQNERTEYANTRIP
jgi:hypothetical protein